MRNPSAQIPTDVYWAAVEPEKLPDSLAAVAAVFWKRVNEAGLLELWRRSHRTFYGTDGDGNWGDSVAVTYGGEEGQFVMARVNHYRSIGQALTAMSTGMRPAFEARSTNVDSKSLREAPLATGIVDYAYRQKDLEALVTRQTESAVKYAEGWVHLRWDPYAGRVHVRAKRPVYEDNGEPKIERVEVPTGIVINGREQMDVTETPVLEEYDEREGDFVASLLSPHEVVRDIERTQHRWIAVPHRESAWELAARYPQHRPALLALRGSEQWPRSLWGGSGWVARDRDDDELTVWCFYHVACDALPGGRYAVIVGDVVLADEEFPFEEIPVYAQIPLLHDTRGVGYTPMWDLLCLQEVYDAVFSAIISQADAGSGGNIIAPKGSEVSVEQLSRAFQLIEYEHIPGHPTGGKPEALELFLVRADHVSLLQVLQRLGETLSGINSVVRGDPDANLKSGAALALVQSLSAHFTSGLQRENARGHERVGTGILRLYKRFATGKRIAEIAGRANRTALKEWTSSDLERIDRVTIELGNPLMRTRAGIQQVAETLLDAEMFENRDEFLLYLETGRLEPAYDEAKRRHLQIEDENEALVDGRPAPVLWGDDHPLHMRRHMSILDDPDARLDQALVARVAEHVESHKTLWVGMDPMIAAALGIQPPPMPPPMRGPDGAPLAPPGPPGAPPGPPGSPPPGGGGEPPPEPGRAVTGGVPSTPGVEPTGMPFMPKNPLTGERANPTPNA